MLMIKVHDMTDMTLLTLFRYLSFVNDFLVGVRRLKTCVVFCVLICTKISRSAKTVFIPTMAFYDYIYILMWQRRQNPSCVYCLFIFITWFRLSFLGTMDLWSG